MHCLVTEGFMLHARTFQLRSKMGVVTHLVHLMSSMGACVAFCHTNCSFAAAQYSLVDVAG